MGTYGCYSSMFQYFGATQFSMSTMDYAGFIQDNWKVSPRLTLELGLRYDYESLPAPPTNLTSATGSFVPYAGLTNAPSDKNNFGPRIGFSYDVFGSGNTVLRGGYGLYYGRVLNGVVASIQFGSGSPNGQFGTASLKPTAISATPQFPFPLAAGAGTKPASFYLAPNLQNPQVHELDMQVQQNLGKGNIFQVSYLGALGRELPNYLDVNLAPPQFTEYIQATAGPLAGTLTAVPTFGSCPSSEFDLQSVPDRLPQHELRQHHGADLEHQLELQRPGVRDSEPLSSWAAVRCELYVGARAGLQPECNLDDEHE